LAVWPGPRPRGGAHLITVIRCAGLGGPPVVPEGRAPRVIKLQVP
jgi:hypothetical protein